jgi:CubicO group peptidase (beta-lactamase class C family)
MTDKERAVWTALRNVVADSIKTAPAGRAIAEINAILEDDDAGCPPLPKPRIDRSLRGWVIVDDSTVYWANEDGIAETARDVTEFDWAWLDDEEWIVRKLMPEDIGFKVRRPSEWTIEEKEELEKAYYDHGAFLCAGKAIDIATRQTYE